ncbi:MAG: rhamnan synthesis F family protein [Synechococcus sp.]
MALLVHGFYLDRLEAVLGSMPAGGGQKGLPPVDLYLSTSRPQRFAAARLLRELGWPRVRLFGVANRGRDIAPFLRHLLPAALEGGHQAFVKLHTKASPHLEEDWGAHLVDSLLASELLENLGGRLQKDPELGMLAPSGTLLPTTVALNHNAEYLLPLLQQRGMEGSWFLAQRFVAGSMMAGRLSALASLLQTPFPLDGFTPEAGQTDGTLAHALERWISPVVLAEGWKVEELPGPARAVPRFGYRWVDERDALVPKPAPAAALPAAGQAMDNRELGLPVAETDGLAEQQPREHPAQQLQIALVADGAVLTEKFIQPTMEPGVGIHEGLDRCDNPKLSRLPARPMS